MLKNLLFFTCFLLCISSCFAENMVTDGGFEVKDRKNHAKHWYLAKKGGVEADMLVTSTEKYSGKYSLKVVNKSGSQNNKFIMIQQSMKLTPDTDYRLSLYAKGKNVSGLQFGSGKNWRPRLQLTNLTEEWKKYEFVFKARKDNFAGDGNYPLLLICGDITEYAYIDDIKVEPASHSIVEIDNSQESPVYFLRKINADHRNLKRFPSNLPQIKLPLNSSYFNGSLVSEEGFQGVAAWGWDDDGIILFVKVKKADGNKIQTMGGKDMWRRDSIQTRLNINGVVDPGTHIGDLELDFAPDNGQVKSYSHDLTRSLNDNEIDSYSSIVGNSYYMAIRLKWVLFPEHHFVHHRTFSMNIIVNYLNKRFERKVAYLANGIHTSKSDAENKLVVFEDRYPFIETFDFRDSVNTRLDGRVVVRGDYPKGWQFAVIVKDSSNKERRFPFTINDKLNRKNAAVFDLKLPIENLAEGKLTVDFDIKGMTSPTVQVVKGDPVKMAKAGLASAELKLQEIEKRIKENFKTPSKYLSAPMDIMKLQIKIQREDLDKCNTPERTRFYTERCKRSTSEINEGIEIFEKQLDDFEENGVPEAWSYVSSENNFKNTWTYGKATNSAGEERTQPIFHAGYGHFNQMVPFIPFFGKIDSNLIQIELGPFYFFKDMKTFEDTDKWSQKYLDEYIFPMMENTWKNNQKITLLISPHYIPRHIYRSEHPEMKWDPKSDSINFTHPMTKKILEKYMRYVLPKVKNSKYGKNIHSLCLTNEPAIGATPYTSMRAMFLEYLKKTYKTVDDLNKLTGKSYASFEEVSNGDVEEPVCHYLYSTFRRNLFGEWHRWMADIVRDCWDIPIHSKIQVYRTIAPINQKQAIEPELMSEITDINGNDNFGFFTSRGTWHSDWILFAMYHNMQRSFKKAVIFNTENHIICDGSIGYVPFGHLYTTTFQQFTQGVDGIVTWVWRPAAMEWIKREPGKAGMQIYRPLSIMGQAKATLDANRMSEELVAFADYDPKIYILYSPTAFIWNAGAYDTDTRNLFTHLSFTGLKPGFVSERKLAKGEFPKDAKVIFAASCPNLKPDAIKGLQKFIDGGGRLVTIEDCFIYDEYGKKLSQSLNSIKLNNPLKGNKYVETLVKITRDLTPVVRVVPTDGKGPSGIQWVVADTDKGYFINVVNYNHTPRRFSLKSGKAFKATDLISRKQITEITVDPLSPLFIKVDFK